MFLTLLRSICKTNILFIYHESEYIKKIIYFIQTQHGVQENSDDGRHSGGEALLGLGGQKKVAARRQQSGGEKNTQNRSHYTPR